MPTTLYSLKGKKKETKILNDLNDLDLNDRIHELLLMLI